MYVEDVYVWCICVRDMCACMKYVCVDTHVQYTRVRYVEIYMLPTVGA